LQVWDFARPRPEPTNQLLPDRGIARTPDGRKVVRWANGQASLLLDGKPGPALPEMWTAGTFTSDGRAYWGIGHAPPAPEAWVAGWDVSGEQPRRLGSFPFVVQAHTALWSVRNDTVLAAYSNYSLSFWDLTASEPRLLSRLPADAPSVFPDGERVLRWEHEIPQLWHRQDDGWVKAWDGPPGRSAVWTPHPTSRFFALYAQGEITIRRADDPKVPAYTIPFAKAPPQKLEFAPDGRHLFVINAFNTVYVLRVPGLDADPDRAAVEWVLSVGGSVHVRHPGGAGREVRAAAELPNEPFTLTVLNLASNKDVTDAELARFRDCKSLLEIWLSNTAVTDAGLAPFRGCKGLKALKVIGTKVTAKGLDEFHAALPGCRIEHDGGTIEPKK
jgi:hypothetical protein